MGAIEGPSSGGQCIQGLKLAVLVNPMPTQTTTMEAEQTTTSTDKPRTPEPTNKPGTPEPTNKPTETPSTKPTEKPNGRWNYILTKYMHLGNSIMIVFALG